MLLKKLDFHLLLIQLNKMYWLLGKKSQLPRENK